MENGTAEFFERIKTADQRLQSAEFLQEQFLTCIILRTREKCTESIILKYGKMLMV